MVLSKGQVPGTQHGLSVNGRPTWKGRECPDSGSAFLLSWDLWKEGVGFREPQPRPPGRGSSWHPGHDGAH